MAKPYSGDLREKVVFAVRAGHTQAEVAEMFRISERSVKRYMGLWRSTGSVASHAKFGGHKKHRLAEHASKVGDLIVKQPDMTLKDIKTALASAKIKVGVTAIHRFLKAAGFSYKKNAGRGRTETQGRGRAARGVAKASKRA